MINSKFSFLKQLHPKKNYFTRRIFDLIVMCLFVSIIFSFTQKDEKSLVTSNLNPNPYIGEIAIFPYNFAPDGWIRCDGQLLPIAQNQALFSLIGTIYGGDGETTFAVPDLRGRTAISYGNGPGLPNYPLGQKGGVTNSLLTTANLPTHNHPLSAFKLPINADVNNIDTDDPDGAFLSAQADDHFASTPSPGSHMTIDVPVTTGNTGNYQEFTNMQPYTALGYYIATVGQFPSEN